MADKKPVDFIKTFIGSYITTIEDEINRWLEDNPEFYLDKMNTVRSDTGYFTIICDFCLREDLEEASEETNLTNELLKGLIGAVNELTDSVKELTTKKD